MGWIQGATVGVLYNKLGELLEIVINSKHKVKGK